MKYIDMHCDTVLQLYRNRLQGLPFGLYQNDEHIDILKMQKGDCLLQNFAIFVHNKGETDALAQFMRYYAFYEQMMDENEMYIGRVLKFDDIEKNRKAGKISSLLTMEEGAPLKGDVEILRAVYRMGVRMVALTWNYPNEIGYPNVMNLLPNGEEDFYTPNTTRGLTEKGLAVIHEMERLGMIIDVSHLSDRGFYDVLQHTTKPFVASHSDARAVCPVVRNLTDDMIRKLGERGGVSGINFCVMFLNDQDTAGRIEDAVRHIKHFVNVGGIGCVGMGSDFDGIRTNVELPNCSYMPRLADALVKSGFSEDEVEQIFWGNVMRVYKEVLK